eukprot:g9028.t1
MMQLSLSWTCPASMGVRKEEMEMPLSLPADSTVDTLMEAIQTHVDPRRPHRKSVWLGRAGRYCLDEFPPTTPLTSLLGGSGMPCILVKILPLEGKEIDQARATAQQASSGSDTISMLTSHDCKSEVDFSSCLGPDSLFTPPHREYVVAGITDMFTCAVFTAQECNKIIARSEEIGYDELRWNPNYRNNTRLVVRNTAFASRLWKRLQGVFSDVSVKDPGTGRTWRAIGLNENFRFCKYEPGQHFAAHCDGGFQRNEQEVSIYTVNIYLSGNHKGGDTRFYMDTQNRGKVTHRVAPSPGVALCFDHGTKSYRHDGEAVGSGLKYLVRTDVMFTCNSARMPHCEEEKATQSQSKESARLEEATRDVRTKKICHSAEGQRGSTETLHQSADGERGSRDTQTTLFSRPWWWP